MLYNERGRGEKLSVVITFAQGISHVLWDHDTGNWNMLVSCVLAGKCKCCNKQYRKASIRCQLGGAGSTDTFGSGTRRPLIWSLSELLADGRIGARVSEFLNADAGITAWSKA
jgi:hypothetical protein